MAFRIHDSVVRGEIDNRIKGMVRGKIWVEGRPEPVILDLKGNAWPDLAGCLLTFSNPLKRIPHQHLESLHPEQKGSIGDLTASRKVRVFDIPLHDALEMIRNKQKPPEHMANSLYLEWFSQRNGRVVIESADYELTISPPEWRMTPEENEQRARQAAAGMDDFMASLDEAIDIHKRGQKDPEEPWDEHDYEKFFKESDARTDKYMELQEKYGDSDDAEEKIAKEMGWDRELTPEEAEEEQRRIDEINAACEAALDEPELDPDPSREGIDWIRTEDGDLRHPLQHRCFESAMKFWHLIENLRLETPPSPSTSGEKKIPPLPVGRGESRGEGFTGQGPLHTDKDLDQFIFEFQTTGAKLAGALGPIARTEPLPEASFTVACLKRALDHLHKSQAGLEAVAPKKLLPEDVVAEARKELFEIREGILRLMDQFRGRGE
jgi:hypothetical protein